VIAFAVSSTGSDLRRGACPFRPPEGLKNGVDTITMANLLDHSIGAMLSRVYAKLQQDPAFTAESAEKAKGG